MPLRPVSELGLVDLTDLASGNADGTTTRRRPTRARSTRSQSARRGPNTDPRGEHTVDQPKRGPATAGGRQASVRSSKRLGGSASKSSGPPQSRAAAAPRNAPSKSKHRKDGSSDGIQRTGSASTHKRRKRSGTGSRLQGEGARKSASSPAGVKRGVSPDRRRRPRAQRELKSASFTAQTKLATAQPFGAKIGISVAAGAMGVAGGLLLSRAALRR